MGYRKCYFKITLLKKCFSQKTNVFDRLKLGIATSDTMRPSEKYVLKPFSKKHVSLVNEVIDNAVIGLEFYINNGIVESMNNYNKKDK